MNSKSYPFTAKCLFPDRTQIEVTVWALREDCDQYFISWKSFLGLETKMFVSKDWIIF